jgi:hypothetical protein
MTVDDHERTPAELFEAVINDYPEGRFAGLESLLWHFCELSFEAERLAVEEQQDTLPSERQSELFWQHLAVTHQMIDLADRLKLWPTEENEMPARLS